MLLALESLVVGKCTGKLRLQGRVAQLEEAGFASWQKKKKKTEGADKQAGFSYLPSTNSQTGRDGTL